MTIRDLEIFVTVAESGHIGDAAKKLFISQPTVSHVISQLEQTYQVKLFERLSRKLYITETGEELLQYARHLLSNFKDMEHYLYHASQQLHIRIGASLTVGTFFLAEMVTDFEQKNPRTRARVYIDNTKNIVRRISDGSLDIAVIEGDLHSENIVEKVVYEDKMVLICGKSHPFAARETVRLDELKNLDCVLREEGSGTRDFLINLTEKQGIPIVKKWVCHSSDSILNIVSAGQGISIVSEALARNNPDIVQVPISDIELHRKFRMIYHKDKYLSTALQNLMGEMERYFSRIHPQGPADR